MGGWVISTFCHVVRSGLELNFFRGQTGNVIVLDLVGGARVRCVEICCKSPSAAKIHRELIGDRSSPLLPRSLVRCPSPAAAAARPGRRRKGRGQSHDRHRNGGGGEGGERARES